MSTQVAISEVLLEHGYNTYCVGTLLPAPMNSGPWTLLAVGDPAEAVVMDAHLLGEGSSMTDEHHAEERALRDIARQLSLTYPSASPEHVAAILQANYDATRDAKVQTYRLVLAERDTRARLRRETPSGPSPEAMRER